MHLPASRKGRHLLKIQILLNSRRIYTKHTCGDEAIRAHDSADYIGICGPRELGEKREKVTICPLLAGAVVDSSECTTWQRAVSSWRIGCVLVVVAFEGNLALWSGMVGRSLLLVDYSVPMVSTQMFS